MLERTAGCVENAGRRFLRDPSNSIRSRASICTGLGQYGSGISETSHWRLTSGTPLRQRDSNTAADSRTNPVSNDSQPPILEFLYPSRTRNFVATCLLRHSKNILTRRKRGGPALSRTFVSEAAERNTQADVAGSEGQNSQAGWARDRLVELLDQGIHSQADRAWQLYLNADSPPDLNSALLAQFGESGRHDDHARSKQLFHSIPEDSRSANEFLSLAKSHIAVRDLEGFKSVWQEAAAMGHGFLCWGFAMAHYIDQLEWSSAHDIWEARPPLEETELWDCMVPYLNVSSIQECLLDLSLLFQPERDTTAEPGSPDGFLRGLAGFFLNKVFSSSYIEDTTTENLLLLLRRFHSAAILTPNHFFYLLETLQSSKNRSTFAQSILIYRNFRWLMDKALPPAKLLGRFISQIAFFKTTAGIEYFLHEFTHFYKKPTIDAYKNAMIAYSRAGDASNVEAVFLDLVAQHGRPQSRRLLTPLLYAHASAGNVKDTLFHFDQILDEYGLEQNEVCWNIVLTAYANAGDLQGCFSTFKMMLGKGLPPTNYTIGILMGLCANRGDIDTCHRVLDFAKQQHISIDTPMLDPIVEANCRNQNMEMAESFAESCLDLDVKGSKVRMWNVLLWNYALKMDLDSITRVRSRMNAAEIMPDGMTYAALMLSLVLLKQTDSARRILRTLHRNRRIHVQEFHYVIIMLGYLRERNRDMVHIIFREIQARFGSPGLSTQLLALQNHLQRDLTLNNEQTHSHEQGNSEDDTDLYFKHAEDFLTTALRRFNPAQLATKGPQLGTKGQSLAETFPAMYYGPVITAYGKRGAVRRAERLFDGYEKHAKLSKTSNAVPIRLLSTLMLAHIRAGHYKRVWPIWEIAYARVRKMATPTRDSDWLPSSETSNRPLPDGPEGQSSILINSGSKGNPSASQWSPILPAYRFMLSRPLSLYMRSLSLRDKIQKIEQTMTAVQRAGFTLTGSNWTTYVQVLATSEDFDNQLKAFAIFEEKFMPNFIGWENTRQGFGVRHSNVPPSIDMIEKSTRFQPADVLGREGRRYWSKIHPDFLQPGYVTFVHLAAVLRQARLDSIMHGDIDLDALHRAAPKTIAAISEMPYLRERFQGVMLRQRQDRSGTDPPPDPAPAEKDYPVWTGGILGVGGRRRKPQGPETFEDTLTQDGVNGDSPQPQSGLSNEWPSSTQTEESAPHQGEEPEFSTLDSESEYDLEAEFALSNRRKLIGTDEELMDDDNADFDELSDNDTLEEELVEEEPVEKRPDDYDVHR